MVVLVIIGALIGAGFASGQEIYLFFYRYGINGILGIFTCSVLISIIIYKVFFIVWKYKIDTYKDFLYNIMEKNKKVENLNICYFMNIIVNTFLLMSFFIMISGFGAYFKQEYMINNFIGSGILATICFTLFMKDMKGVAKVNSIVVPILIVFIIIVGIKNIILIDLNDIGNNILNMKNGILNNWFIQSIIYASYNIILLIPVLVNLKKYIKNKEHIMLISIISGLILLILAIIIYVLLVKVDVDFNTIEMPVVYAISDISMVLKKVYGVVILLSIFTTANSIGISFLENIVKDRKSFPLIGGVMCITATIISNIGFSKLVTFLFPVFGYLGLIQIYYILKK